MADLLGGSTVGGYLVESTKGSQEKANKALADAKTYADGKSTALEAILANKADSASPTFTGTPTAPTASAGANTTQLATTAFVTTAVNNKTSITGNAGSATKLATARTISLGGDVTGSASFDGSGNITITATVVDDSHNHVIGDVDGLQGALDLKAALASPTFTGTPSGPTASAGANTTQLATTAFVTTAVNNKTTITGNAGSATKLATARTISLGGDLSGSASFDGSSNITITATVADNSHNHSINDVAGLSGVIDNVSTLLSFKVNMDETGKANINTQNPVKIELTDASTQNKVNVKLEDLAFRLGTYSNYNQTEREFFEAHGDVNELILGWDNPISSIDLRGSTVYFKSSSGGTQTLQDVDDLIKTKKPNMTVGSSAPSSPGTLELWYNPTSGTLSIWNGSAWGELSMNSPKGTVNFNTNNARLVIPVGVDKYAT